MINICFERTLVSGVILPNKHLTAPRKKAQMNIANGQKDITRIYDVTTWAKNNKIGKSIFRENLALEILETKRNQWFYEENNDWYVTW